MSERTYDVVVSREFAAPIDRVWHAWTEPEGLRAWWGPRGFTCPRADVDLRVGGRILVTMRAPAEYGGGDYHNSWTITALEAPHRLEYEHRFADADGRPIPRAEAGIPDGVPDFAVHEVRLTDLGDGRTRLDMAEYGFLTEEARDLSKSGLDQCLDKMAEYLEATTA